VAMAEGVSVPRIRIIEKDAALLGLRVTDLMRRRGLGLRELARNAGVPLSTLQKVCGGVGVQTSIWTMAALADTLNTSVDYLIGRSSSVERER